MGDGRDGEEDRKARYNLGKELGLHLDVGTLFMTCAWDRWGKAMGENISRRFYVLRWGLLGLESANQFGQITSRPPPRSTQGAPCGVTDRQR